MLAMKNPGKNLGRGSTTRPTREKMVKTTRHLTHSTSPANSAGTVFVCTTDILYNHLTWKVCFQQNSFAPDKIVCCSKFFSCWCLLCDWLLPAPPSASINTWRPAWWRRGLTIDTCFTTWFIMWRPNRELHGCLNALFFFFSFYL